jgi:hypothetical protein
LQYTIKQPHYASVLLGFNPIEYARKVRVPEFGHTFFDVASQLQQAAKEVGSHCGCDVLAGKRLCAILDMLM